MENGPRRTHLNFGAVPVKGGQLKDLNLRGLLGNGRSINSTVTAVNYAINDTHLQVIGPLSVPEDEFSSHALGPLDYFLSRMYKQKQSLLRRRLNWSLLE